MSSFSIGTGYNTYNYTQYGNTVDFTKNANFYLQMDDGTAQGMKLGDGFQRNGIIATDAGDTISLSNKWHVAHTSATDTGYRVSDQGAAGIEYDSDDGGKILITGPGKVQADRGSGSAGTISLVANLSGATNDAFGDNKAFIDRVNWAIGNAGGKTQVGSDGTILKTDLETAIQGLEKAKTTQDANSPGQQGLDQRQIDYIKTFLDT